MVVKRDQVQHEPETAASKVRSCALWSVLAAVIRQRFYTEGEHLQCQHLHATYRQPKQFKCSFGQTVAPNCLQPSATALQPHISLWRPRASVCLDQSHRLRCRRATDIIFTILIKDIDQQALNLFYLTWSSVSFSHILPAWSQIKGVLIVTVSAHRHRPTQSKLSDNTHRPTNICDSVWRWNAGTAHSAFIKPVSLCGPAAPHDRSSMSKQKNPEYCCVPEKGSIIQWKLIMLTESMKVLLCFPAFQWTHQ